MTADSWISLGLMVAIAAIVTLAGLWKASGTGKLIAVAIIAASLFLRHRGLDSLGFIPPKNWPVTILWALGLGIAIAFLSTLLIEPASEKITGKARDLRAYERMRGDWKALLSALVLTWIVVSFFEELIFRGFIMSELGDLFGMTGVFASLILLISSAIFGMAHWYQGKASALSSALVGLLLGNTFIWSGYSLWLPILTHAVIDTLGLLFIYLKLDSKMKGWAW
jgi:membrane protease YdiL (CAAX protease family)